MRARERVAAVGLLTLVGLSSAAPALAACSSSAPPATGSAAGSTGCTASVLGTESSRDPSGTAGSEGGAAGTGAQPQATVVNGRGALGGLLPHTGADALALVVVGGAVTATGVLLVSLGRRGRGTPGGGSTLGLVIAGGLLTLGGAGAALDARPATAAETVASCPAGSTSSTGSDGGSASCSPTSTTGPTPARATEPTATGSTATGGGPGGPTAVVAEAPYALLLPLAGAAALVAGAGVRSRRARG